MQDLKIKVNNEAESREAQELLFELGAKKVLPDIVCFSKDVRAVCCICNSVLVNTISFESCSDELKETTLAELRDMVKPMQEYLNTETYEYKRAHKKPDGEWVCIPGGADFYVKSKITKDNFFFCMDNSGVIETYDTVLKNLWHRETLTTKDLSKNYEILWQRPTQPEALPFIDDEPQSLNEQYAEIEQVRQNGLKLDNGKPRHSLLPKGSISSIITVLEFGAKKYEANNWQKVDNAKERYYDAAMRHIDSWWHGEKFDQETGIHHLAHAATNLLFLKWFDDKTY